MRFLALSIITIAAAVGFSGTTVQAKDYPFCRRGEGGPGDCKYETYEQCLAAISGTSGDCQPNYWLSQSSPASASGRPPRRQGRYGQGY